MPSCNSNGSSTDPTVLAHPVVLVSLFCNNIFCINYMYTELQIRGSNEDNSKIFFSYFSMKTYVVTPH